MVYKEVKDDIYSDVKSSFHSKLDSELTIDIDINLWSEIRSIFFNDLNEINWELCNATGESGDIQLIV